MKSLEELGLIEPLATLVFERMHPYLEICVGPEVVHWRSDEGKASCLDQLQGHVRHFNRNAVRVPQIGWKEVQNPGSSDFLRD